eukprot:SAG25_NODE_2227_length_1821_cov_1.117886_2_plen_56_part_00
MLWLAQNTAAAQAEVLALIGEELPEHARHYGLDVIARLKVAHKYPAVGGWQVGVI